MTSLGPGPMPNATVKTLEHGGIRFPEADYKRFRGLVEDTGSLSNLARITARQSLREFQEQHGKEVCDAMFARLKAEKPGWFQ